MVPGDGEISKSLPYTRTNTPELTVAGLLDHTIGFSAGQQGIKCM
jgi:hypothetical protein